MDQGDERKRTFDDASKGFQMTPEPGLHYCSGVTVHLPLRRVRPIDSPMISKELAWRNGLPRGGICDSLGAWDPKTNLT